MGLSRPARELAAEINHHDWSDAPFRADRAGHTAGSTTGPSGARPSISTTTRPRACG
jgi:hypothetical protein